MPDFDQRKQTMVAGQGDVLASRINQVDSRYFLAVVAGIGWLAGIWLASVTELTLLYWLLMSGAAALAAMVTWRVGRIGLILAGIAALALGAGRYLVAQPVTDPGHLHYYNGWPNVTLSGHVAAEPEKYDTFQQFRLAVDEITTSGRIIPVTGALLAQTNRYTDIPYGAKLRLVGDLEPPDKLGSPGYAEFLRRQGILSVMSYPQIAMTGTDDSRPLYRALLAVRERGREVIRQSITEPQAALLSGILLGDDSGMSRETIEAFRVTGMTHIIAISGFNIALLIVLLDRLTALFMPRRLAALVIIVFIALYAVLVGGAPSVIRAAMMGVAYLFATRMLGRPALAVASLFVASFMMTLADPMALWDIGFQLSFAATMGLVLFAGPWTTWTKQRLAGGSDSPARWGGANLLADVLVVTLAAQILTLPLLLFHFGRLSLISLPANLLVLPVQPAVMVTGGVTLLSGMIWLPLGRLAGIVAWPFLAYTTGVIELLAQVPRAAIPFQLSARGLVWIYVAIAMLVGLVTLTKRRRASSITKTRVTAIPVGMAALVLIGMITIAFSVARLPDGRLHVVFLDVGQGDATFIQTPAGHQLLIDGGRYPSVLLEELGRHMAFWDRTIDIVIATHPDDDHIAGLVDVVERYRVGQLLTNGADASDIPAFEALLSASSGRATAVHPAQAGEALELGDGVRLEILHPPPGFHTDSRNEESLVMRLTYGQYAIMMAGDAGTAAEAELMTTAGTLTADVLKAGHHGANTSSSEPFLAAVQPQIIVISAGEDNSYGHPHPAMLERVAAIGATVLRTDELGTIEMMSDGLQMWWQSTD